jgi:hypothetical protein
LSNSTLINKEKNYISRPRLINKNKEEFKEELLGYARKNFSDQIEDFSEASLGGMLLDFAAIVGESLTHYVDQQISELNYETATSEYSIISHLRRSNITSGFASPSSTIVSLYIFAPVNSSDNTEPDPTYLPIILKETSFNSKSGVPFLLEEDIDFSDHKIIKSLSIGNSDTTTHYLIESSGIASSGEVTSETFSFDEDKIDDFLSYTLSKENVTKILKVSDNSTDINDYKQVEFLSQDTVYQKVESGKHTFFSVNPAPFRFIVEKDFDDGLTTIRFGNGNNNISEDGFFTNPEEISLPLRGRDYENAYSLDPKRLINSPSLGVTPAGKTLTVKYKSGGGTDHNTPAGSINEISNLKFKFPNLIANSNIISDGVITSLSVSNKDPSVGGTDALTFQELVRSIPTAKKMQSRIVNHEDLLARIHTMPSNFGRISKAAILDNEYTKVSKDLYIICKDEQNFYIHANEAIKYNLSKFINEYRLIGDSFNIIDASIFNFGVFLKVKIRESNDPIEVINKVKQKINLNMRFEALEIGQGINVNDIVKIALDVPEVLTVVSDYRTIIQTKNSKTISSIDLETDRSYSDNNFSSLERYEDGIFYPPKGGIFELKYINDIDIMNG